MELNYKKNMLVTFPSLAICILLYHRCRRQYIVNCDALMLCRRRRSAVKRNDIKRSATRALRREPAEDPIVIGYRTNMADARGSFLRVSVRTHTGLYIRKLYIFTHTLIDLNDEHGTWYIIMWHASRFFRHNNK